LYTVIDWFWLLTSSRLNCRSGTGCCTRFMLSRGLEFRGLGLNITWNQVWGCGNDLFHW
jgi:hypothetical protein